VLTVRSSVEYHCIRRLVLYNIFLYYIGAVVPIVFDGSNITFLTQYSGTTYYVNRCSVYYSNMARWSSGISGQMGVKTNNITFS